MPDTATFSVLDAIDGTAYPIDTVTIYTNVAALHKFNKLDQELAVADKDATPGIEEQMAEVRETIKASGLTFHGQGFTPKVREAIDTETRSKFGNDANLDYDEPFVYRRNKYIATTIIKVVNAEGAEDSHVWTVEDVERIHDALPLTEFNRLWEFVQTLSFEAWAFDQAVTADFS